MLKLLRLAVIVLSAAFFAGTWYVAQSLLEPFWLRWFSGIVTVLWALQIQVWMRLGAVADVRGLSSREHERLNLRLRTLRMRIWWVGAVGLASSVLMWVMAAMNLATQAPLYASFFGLLFGVSLSHLVLVPVWMNEAQAFIDEMKRRDELAKQRQQMLQAMS